MQWASQSRPLQVSRIQIRRYEAGHLWLPRIRNRPVVPRLAPASLDRKPFQTFAVVQIDGPSDPEFEFQCGHATVETHITREFINSFQSVDPPQCGIPLGFGRDFLAGFFGFAECRLEREKLFFPASFESDFPDVAFGVLHYGVAVGVCSRYRLPSFRRDPEIFGLELFRPHKPFQAQ